MYNSDIATQKENIMYFSNQQPSKKDSNKKMKPDRDPALDRKKKGHKDYTENRNKKRGWE